MVVIICLYGLVLVSISVLESVLASVLVLDSVSIKFLALYLVSKVLEKLVSAHLYINAILMSDH